jgi:hypothetical protein
MIDRLYPVTVVDNFYDNPEEIRKFALEQTFTNNTGKKEIFPGGRTDELHVLNRDLFDTCFRKIFAMFHDYGFSEVEWDVSCKFQLVNENYETGWIHKDNTSVLAGVIYLTPDAQLNSGTSIYIPNSKFNQKQYEEYEQYKDNYFKNIDSIDPTVFKQKREENNFCFNETIKINNVFNRLVLYQGSSFHSANNFFGKTLEDSRLTQVFFVNKIMSSRGFPLQKLQYQK